MASFAAGPDFFKTPEGGATFAFTNSLPIPDHFFGRGSKRHIGVIHFQGKPLDSFTDARTGKKYSTGGADTVVLRERDVTIEGNAGSGTTPIELVALSLTSTKQIEVEIGNKKHKFHVHATVSKKKRSTGTMTFKQTSAGRGVFTSELNVVPLFTFVGEGGEEKHLDLAEIEVPAEKAAAFKQLGTLVASDVPWEQGSQGGQETGKVARAAIAIGEAVVHTAPTHIHEALPYEPE